MNIEEMQQVLEAERRMRIKNMAKKFVYVQVVKEGYHWYPEAAESNDLATGDTFDVSHLALRHMHYFYIKVWVEVKHSNRNIEFIQLRRWIDSLYGNDPITFGSKSCEMIAEDLFDHIAIKYPGVEIRIDVSEDNINGALVEFLP